jgi:hypothetical protein
MSANREQAYLAKLDSTLSALAAEPGMTVEQAIAGARGASPTLVVERLRVLGLYTVLSRDRESTPSSHTTFLGPELHPLDFEWYFTPECADELARLLHQTSAPTLCLGAPTLATAIARASRPAVLVDRNPLVRHRLPPRLGYLQLVLHDLTKPLHLNNHFPVVFFDAPWYPDYLYFWLWQAAQAATLPADIAFALFPSLVRPDAEEERSQILAQASLLGEVTLMEDALTYETPIFEREALSCWPWMMSPQHGRGWPRFLGETRHQPWPAA